MSLTVYAETGAMSWAELQNKINSGGTVTLQGDMTAEEKDQNLTVENAKNVILDLNGHTLSRGLIFEDKQGSVIVVKKGGTLTIRDSSAAGSGKVTGGYAENGGGIYNEGTVNLESGAVTGNLSSESGGIYNVGTLVISGGVVRENVAKEGGGIYNSLEGTVSVRGGAKVSENKTTEDSGGGIATYGKLTVSEQAEISSNFAYTDGGGIWIEENASVTMTGGVVTKNNAYSLGSGICLYGSINLSGIPVIKDNTGDDI